MRFVNISKRDGSLLPTCSLTKPFLFIFCILFEKLGHISPSNLCELQIRPFRPLLLTFMNRKLGGRPNICASVFFINSTDLTHYSSKIQNEIETRPISPSNRILGSLHVLINCWDRDWVDLYSPKKWLVAFWSSKSFKVLKGSERISNLHALSSPGEIFTTGQLGNENYLGHIWAHTFLTPFTSSQNFLRIWHSRYTDRENREHWDSRQGCAVQAALLVDLLHGECSHGAVSPPPALYIIDSRVAFPKISTQGICKTGIFGFDKYQAGQARKTS